MLESGFGLGFDEALYRFGAFQTKPDALCLADFSRSDRRFSDDFELVVVVALEGRDDLLPAGTDLKDVIVMDLVDNGE